MNTSSNNKLTEEVLFYMMRRPITQNEQTPLILLMHGVGSNEEDLFSLADYLPESALIVSTRAPYVMGPGSYAWFQFDVEGTERIINTEQAEVSRKLIVQFIGQLKERFTFDEKQVYLCGFSQGGIMAYSVGLTHPELVKGIAVMSGRLLDEVKPLIVANAALSGLKIFISHGTQDNVLDIHFARDSYAYLKTLNSTPFYKEYPEVHTINNEMLFDLVKWLNLPEEQN
jgi:phospholipase/carboxylesterase